MGWYCFRILLKAGRHPPKKNVWGTIGEPGITYASSFGFSADIERGTVGVHVDGIENASVKAYMKAEIRKKGCPCNVRHGWGYCPRNFFDQGPREDPPGATPRR